jgi:RNA polymerase sigma-70 factor (ECF subfamily)
MEEKTAIIRLKQGNLDGLEALIGRYQVQAIHAAQLIVRDPPLAEEVVQTAFIRIAEKIHQFDEDRPFGPWFLRIVVNDALKAAQRQKRSVPLEEEPDDDASRLAHWLVDPQPQPEKLLEIKESSQVIRLALNRLTPEQRAVVVMRYFLDMSETEMSAKLKRPTSTIKWWLRVARERLRRRLRSSHALQDDD